MVSFCLLVLVSILFFWFWFCSVVYTLISSCRRMRRSQKTVYQMCLAMNMPGSFWLTLRLKDCGCPWGERSKLCSVSVQGLECCLAVCRLLNKMQGVGNSRAGLFGPQFDGCRVYTAQHEHSGLCSLLASYVMKKPKGAQAGSDGDGRTVTPDLAVPMTETCL